MIDSRNVKRVKLGQLEFGCGDVYVQSMLNKPSDDIAGNVAQAKALEQAGCDILRVAIPDMQAVALIDAIKQETSIPLVADIHFDYRLALASIRAGIDKIRINPGNIGEDAHVKEIARACANAGVPIRIGVNGGSLEQHILQKYGRATPMALVESAKYHISLLLRYDFDQIVVSMKSSDVPTTIAAYELFAQQLDYPLHLGVTEAGTERMGLIKSAIGIGSLLAHGIGETIRVSLTSDPVEEVAAGLDILKALGLRGNALTLVSCPTCGRTKIDIIALTHQVEQAVKEIHKPMKVAIMGCVVNGPGEAKDADLGIAGGDGCAILFKKGKIVCKIAEQEIVPTLLAEIDAF